MLQHSPEQEEMRAFPGPLAKYVLTDFKEISHFKISFLHQPFYCPAIVDYRI